MRVVNCVHSFPWTLKSENKSKIMKKTVWIDRLLYTCIHWEMSENEKHGRVLKSIHKFIYYCWPSAISWALA